MTDAATLEAPAETKKTAKPKWTLDPIRAAEAAKALIESIGAMADGDDDLVADMIEGETELFDVIDRLLARMAENRGYATGCDIEIANMKDRRDRFEKRVATDRALIEQALVIASAPSVQRPLASLSLSTRGAKIVIDDEAAIPADYWKAGDPKLDRAALSAALAEREAAIATALAAIPEDDQEARQAALTNLGQIPGAHLEQAPPTLTVRVK